MEQLKLTALRDFAIEHLPRAQRVSKQPHATQNGYHIALYGTATLVPGSATASAVELAAARLLHAVMGLLVVWDDVNTTPDHQKHLRHEAISAAHDLCALTGKTLAWLTDAPEQEPAPLPPSPVPDEKPEIAPVPAARLSAPPPGINLTTEEAAEYLNVQKQTLHKWASLGTGPLQPIRQGIRRLAWPSDEVLRVMRGK
jgi:hypothetical protein